MRTTKSRGAPLFIYLFILKTKTGTETKWMNERRIRNTTPLNLLCLFFSTEPRTKSHSSPSSSSHSFVCFFFLLLLLLLFFFYRLPNPDATRYPIIAQCSSLATKELLGIKISEGENHLFFPYSFFLFKDVSCYWHLVGRFLVTFLWGESKN